MAEALRSQPLPIEGIQLAGRKPWYVRLGGAARKKPLGAFGAAIIFVLCVTALFGADITIFDTTIVPGFSPKPASETNIADSLQSPNWEHPFGTDQLGRDILSRVIHGARSAMIIGVAATTLGLLAGTLIGMVSAYAGGLVDLTINRVMDSFMALPPLILLLVLVTVLSPSRLTVIIVLIFFLAPSSSRVIRGSTLVLKEAVYVEAARALGASPLRIMGRHIFPNIVAPILVLFSVLIGGTILVEAALSFLGLGANKAEAPTWGFMLFEAVARGALDRFWWLSIFPGVAITLAVLSFNLLGDALRDLWDPRLRGTGAGA
jgi:peptide/nickel transport system permease protein